MSIALDQSGSGLYLVTTGTFKGLFTALSDAVIPDEYLADMSNLAVNEYGALVSVLKPAGPVSWAPNAGALGCPISSIGNMGVYIGQTDTLCDNLGNTKISADGVGEVPVVRHLNGSYVLSPGPAGGLYNVATGVKITAATAGFTALIGFFALAVYEMRMWLGVDRTLRGSAAAQDMEAVDAVNGNRRVWGPWTGPNAQISMIFPNATVITHLVPTNSGLLIFSEQDVFAMATFFGGTAVPIYHGSDLPHGQPGNTVRQFPCTDGQSVYYAGDNALFVFSGSPKNLSSVLALPRIYSFYCGEYNDRVWFLVCTAAHPTGAEANYIYAINKLTGFWEKYDVQMTAKAGAVYNTPTALAAGVPATGENQLMIGTSIGTLYNWYGTMTDTGSLPWVVKTKAFSPTHDQPHSPVKFLIDYRSQSVTSPVVVTTYLDGVAIATTIAFDMSDGVGGKFMHRAFDIPNNKTCNTCQFLISGTGKAELLSIGYSLSILATGDINP